MKKSIYGILLCMSLLIPSGVYAVTSNNSMETSVADDGNWRDVKVIKEIIRGTRNRIKNIGSYQLQYNPVYNRFRIWFDGDWRDVFASDLPERGNYMFSAPVGFGGRNTENFYFTYNG